MIVAFAPVMTAFAEVSRPVVDDDVVVVVVPAARPLQRRKTPKNDLLRLPLRRIGSPFSSSGRSCGGDGTAYPVAMLMVLLVRPAGTGTDLFA